MRALWAIVCLLLLAGCATEAIEKARDLQSRGRHAEAGDSFVEAATASRIYGLFSYEKISDYYSNAASEFSKAGDHSKAANAAQRCIRVSEIGLQAIAESKEDFNNSNHNDTLAVGFKCKLMFASSKAQIADWEPLYKVMQEFLQLNPRDTYHVSYRGRDQDSQEWAMEVLKTRDPELLARVNAHMRASIAYVHNEDIQEAQREKEKEADRERKKEQRQEYERQHPEIARAREAEITRAARAREAEAAAHQKFDRCKSNCDSQTLPCIAACYGNSNDPMCPLRCQVTLETCKTGCEEQRDALIAGAGGTPLGTSNSGTAALLQGMVAVGDSLAAGKPLPPHGASEFAAAAAPPTVPSAGSGNLALQQSQPSANGLPSSGTSGFPAAATSPYGGPTHSCPTSLAHLANQLPQYDVPDLQQARSAILQLSTTAMYQRMLASGITPANGAKMAIQDAQKIAEQREIAKQCIRQTAANPESVISSLEHGTYRSPNRAAGGVLDGCAQGYVLMHYSAVAAKASAVAIACMAKQ
ncbi:MAG: hypothetical protein IT391_14605 [Nitrospira sp.]|nr:hypothetical protein [Nitrospira sp.]